MFCDFDYLEERISSKATGLEGSDIDFEAWREILNVSGKQIFPRRLASLGLDENQARRLTRRTGQNSDSDPPEWLQTLREALDSSDPDPGFFDVGQPFAKIWAPIGGYAAKQMIVRRPHLVSEDAVAEFVRFLHAEIAAIAAEPTYLVFHKFRAQEKTFEEFVDRQQQNRCEDIFSAYPALARCIGELIQDWIETTNAFFARLESDAGLLSAEFGIDELRLTSVSMGLSDRHAGGYQVIRAAFGDCRVLYKPKDMSLETFLPRINEWLSTENYPTRFRFPQSIDCRGYGWSEWIDQKPCLSPEEVKRYYRQSGALLCLAHLLNAKDLLFENIIACGADPVPIDLETFLQPEARTFDRIGQPLDGDHPAYKWKGSVIDIALLPFWQFSSSHPMCDLSGLGCKNEDLPPGRETGWLSINTTEMKAVTRSVRIYRTKNEVIYLGKVQIAADFVQEIEAGFAEFYRFATRKKESLLQFLSAQPGAKSRLIFRPTQLYSLLVRNSLQARNLESGIKRSIVFEQLYRPSLKSGHLTSDLQRIFDFERDVLLRLDIPRFYIPVESTDLDLGREKPIAGFLWAAPLDTVKRRIRHATESGLENHLEVIRSALSRKPQVISNPLSTLEQLHLVREYADLIYAEANPERNAFVWNLPSFVDAPVPMIERLAIYSGQIGILVFLAAADRALHRKTSPAFLDHCYRKLETLAFESAPIGAGNGIGGLIYGSIILGTILKDRSWIELAGLLSERLEDDRILAEEEPDVLYGAAGLLLAMRKLQEIRPSKRSEQLATLCVRNLCAKFRDETGWMRPNGDCSLGFAHGTAGIAFALARGADLADDVLALAFAEKAIEFDRRYFDQELHNWPSTTRHRDKSMRAWCSGQTGMLLARAGVWDRTRDPQLLSEIESGLIHLPDLLGLDHWCCGNAGAAEVLIYLAKVLDRKDLLEKGKRMIDETVRRALKTVYYRFSPDIGENYCFQPSLFRGLAGIGYTLLRAMNPSELPCIMAFE